MFTRQTKKPIDQFEKQIACIAGLELSEEEESEGSEDSIDEMLNEVEQAVYYNPGKEVPAETTHKAHKKKLDAVKTGIKASIDNRLNLQKSILKRIDDHNSKLNDPLAQERDIPTPRDPRELLELKHTPLVSDPSLKQDWRQQVILSDLVEEIDEKISEK